MSFGGQVRGASRSTGSDKVVKGASMPSTRLDWESVLRCETASSEDFVAVLDESRARNLCDGHFPGDPFIPGAYLAALMVEAGRQLLAARSHQVSLEELEKCNFHAPARPHARVQIKAWVRDQSNPPNCVLAEVWCGTALAARACLKYRVMK